ncbi:MAG TPA: acetoacetate--CoA ligase, partial [Planctomycetota bacterium]|nr:acetoacetate--CoA ligase [Planctomycetota bacterium]
EPRAFWRALLERSGLLYEGALEPVRDGDDVRAARYFPALRLNYAENLLRSLRPGDDAQPAVIGWTEEGARTLLTRGQLRSKVLALAGALRALGIGPGDRVACMSSNAPPAIVACLAATALGAVWSTVAPDLGTEATRDRFAQLEPKLLFAVAGYRHHGAGRPVRDKLSALVRELPSLRHVIALGEPLQLAGVAVPEYSMAALLQQGPPLQQYPRLPFDHPLFVLFSSGTTGKPKAIVHSLGGTLLEHWKELRLHSDLSSDDVLYFHTTCGWMMWNWQLSALACGTTIVLLDGSVSFPQSDALLLLLMRERVSVFGTSPAYLQYLRDAGISPRELGDWPALRAIQSTGSILFDAQYHWVKEHWKHLPIQSISGGTDVLGCLVLGHPELPVHAGESQCVSLGIDVQALDGGNTARVGSGELVVANPFPSRPLGFLHDADGARCRDAYYAAHPGLWTHGDFVQLTAHGSARILGRSDGTLNVKGVRIGPAEIYAILQGFPGLIDCMALEQQAEKELGGSRLVLLVVLADGQALDRPFVLKLKKELSQRGSPAHVPAVVAKVASVPVTFSGKKSERAATDALHGREVTNRAAIKNPECLDEIAGHADLRLAEA